METKRLTGKELLDVVGELDSLDAYSKETSLYPMHLLDKVTAKDLYVVTKNGRAYVGSTIKCKETNEKEVLSKDSIAIIVDEENNVFQFVLAFKDGSNTDARGEYARNQLKIVQQRKRIKQ